LRTEVPIGLVRSLTGCYCFARLDIKPLQPRAVPHAPQALLNDKN